MDKKPHFILSLIAAIMLIAALAKWPYGYYQLLRFVVCGVSIYIAYTAYNRQKMWATWLFGFIALLFNPVFQIKLSRELWQPIDIICALLFLAIAFIIEKPKERKET